MKSPFHHIKHAHKTFEHFHQNLHHAFVFIVGAIIGMLRGASQLLVPSINASRQWGGFITNDFWDQNPTDNNIKYALFGDGTPGNTAYTRLRDSSCIPTSVQYLSTLNGLTGAANTIYVIDSGTYTLTYPITLSTCSALIGRDDVYIKPNTGSFYPIIAGNGQNRIIIDNIKINGNNIATRGINFPYPHSNCTINNVDVYQNTGYGIFFGSHAINIHIYNSRFYNNTTGLYSSSSKTINNCQFFNNTLGIDLGSTSSPFQNVSINNSQIYNNYRGIQMGDDINTCTRTPCIQCVVTLDHNNSINNSTIYNNTYGIYTACFNNSNGTTIYSYTYNLNNTNIYNNNYGIRSKNSKPTFPYYGTLKLFSNSQNTGGGGNTLLQGTSFSIPSWTDGILDTSSTTINYDRVTNPQNGNGQRLLNGTNRMGLRGVQAFTITQPIRYIFGLNIPKQTTPVRYHGNTLEEYGTDGADYKTTKYIAEPDSALSLEHQDLVNQYFGSGSAYTQNRQTNGCSLSAFQVKTLNPQNFSTAYHFEDHTIYILTGGEYRYNNLGGNAFVFNGNCIALVGNKNTRFTKSGGPATSSILYANNKRNIIIDNIRVDAYYYGTNSHSGPADIGIKFDQSSNNNTINNTQVYNSTSHGIYLGQGSHHNTIINTQSFNNGNAGIHLIYASNYNVINNTQTYNNGQYGIRFANGSSRNTMNNFQAYRNAIGVFGDLTTKENILNRAAIYNNSNVGIYFRSTSGNILNDVKVYNNTVGIRTFYSSLGNIYYGNLELSNITSNFEGTNGNDTSLAPGTAGHFPLPGTLTTGTIIMSCLDATNPTLSGNGATLFNSNCTDLGYNASFRSQYNTYVNYAFGLNIYKQIVPVRYDSGNILTEASSQYDSGKYIAEVFAIRDDEPENIYFEGSGSTQLNTWYTTNVSTASVLNIAVPVTLTFDPITTSGSLIISGVTLNTTTGTVNNGDTIQVKLLTRPGYNETITGTVTIGSLTTGFAVKTRDISQTPTSGSFDFAHLTSIPLDTFTGSTVTVAGIETGVLAGITFDPITTSGWLEVYSGSAMINSGTTGVQVYNGNQIKVIAKSSSGYGQTITGYVTIGLGTGEFTITTKGSDITPPTTPTLTYPLSGEELFFITRERVAATDTGSGIEGYVYQIAEDTNFVDIIDTGFIATVTGTMGSPDTDFDATSDTFYRRMQARDRDGNTGARSNIGRFEAINSHEREFTNEEHANLRTNYDSNEITLEGIKDGLSIRASIDDNGVLYENGNDKGTGTLVQNGDNLYITIRSSNNYDRTISSVLTIANRELEFNVTTKTNADAGCTLSEEDETAIQDIFDSLVENYSGSEERYDEFLYTMQSMLEDEIDFTNDCNLQYLQDLIEDELGIHDEGTINTGAHIAPNCKEYPVSFDNLRSAYTSPTFKVITYFANRDALIKYIDSKNPGDCHINTYGVSSRVFTNIDPNKHIAANGKIYTIQTSTQGGYTSNEFSSARYFTTINALRAYIDTNNPPPEVRNHQVDTTFSPQTYTAPNGKEYTIYHTDRGYMSYKLMKVRYFSTLAELQAYISKNNSR